MTVTLCPNHWRLLRGQPSGGSSGVFTSNLKEDAMAKKAKKKKAAKKKKK
jgi:hypothetical protein